MAAVLGRAKVVRPRRIPSSERRRRPSFHAFVADGTLPPGIACDDFAAVHFAGTELREAVASKEGAGAYRVTIGEDGAVEERWRRAG